MMFWIGPEWRDEVAPGLLETHFDDPAWNTLLSANVGAVMTTGATGRPDYSACAAPTMGSMLRAVTMSDAGIWSSLPVAGNHSPVGGSPSAGRANGRAPGGR